MLCIFGGERREGDTRESGCTFKSLSRRQSLVPLDEVYDVTLGIAREAAEAAIL